jgi:putative heme transporter
MPTIAQPLPLPLPRPAKPVWANPRVVAAAVVGAGLLALALAKSGPLVNALQRAVEADPRWVLSAVGLEVLSVAGYVVLMHHVVTRSTPKLGWRHSYSLSVGGTAASRLLPTAGLGGVALCVMVLRRAGLQTHAIAERMLAFLLLLYSVFVGSLFVLGAALASGALPAHGPRVVAAGAALGAATLGFVLLAALRRPHVVGRIVPRARPHLGVLDAAARRAGGHLRRPHAALAGAPAWWGFDVAVLWSMLHAFGAAPPVWVVLFAYFLGSVANLVPFPGALSGGLIGVLATFGVEPATALLAVLAYRAVALWLPTPFGLLAIRWLKPDELRGAAVLEPRFSRTAADAPQTAPAAIAA